MISKIQFLNHSIDIVILLVALQVELYLNIFFKYIFRVKIKW